MDVITQPQKISCQRCLSEAPHSINLKSNRKAFTLIEVLIVVATVALITAIAIPALNTSKQDAAEVQADALEKTLNEGILRVKLKTQNNNGTDLTGLPTPLTGNNAEEAINWLVDNGYVQ